MSDRIEESREPWQAIPRAVLRDGRLSPAAKGGLVTLLSHDAGWIRSCIALLQRENKCGRTSAKAIMKELSAVGYARLERSRDERGQLRSFYVVSPHAEAPEPAASPGTGSPTPADTQVPGSEPDETRESVAPSTVGPSDGEPGRSSRSPAVEPTDEGQELVATKARERDPIFDALAEVEGLNLAELDPDTGRRIGVAKAKLVRNHTDVTPGEIIRRAANYPSHFGDATITAGALVKWWPRLGQAGRNGNGRGSGAARTHALAEQLRERGQ